MGGGKGIAFSMKFIYFDFLCDGETQRCPFHCSLPQMLTAWARDGPGQSQEPGSFSRKVCHLLQPLPPSMPRARIFLFCFLCCSSHLSTGDKNDQCPGNASLGGESAGGSLEGVTRSLGSHGEGGRGCRISVLLWTQGTAPSCAQTAPGQRQPCSSSSCFIRESQGQ